MDIQDGKLRGKAGTVKYVVRGMLFLQVRCDAPHPCMGHLRGLHGYLEVGMGIFFLQSRHEHLAQVVLCRTRL